MATPPSPLAVVVLLTKDEHDLIEDFLAYHGALFGRPNVVVIDNGSSHPRVLAAYEAHRALGGVVVVDARPFPAAVSFMTEHMAALAHAPGAPKFLLPLETDEFIFTRPLEGKETTASLAEVREAVLGALEAVPSDVSVVRYSAFWCSCVDPADAGYARGAYSRPAEQITRFADQGWDKLAIRADAFVRMSQWCHHAEVRSGREAVCADLGLLHFHHIGRRRTVERAESVVVSLGYDAARPLSGRLEALGAVRGAPVACGHKAEQVLEHLERQATLEAFRMHLGRLPASPEEMRRFSDVEKRGRHKTPEDAVRHELAAGRLRRAITISHGASPPSWEALLYHETRAEHRYEVRQVANALRELDGRTIEKTSTSLEDVIGRLVAACDVKAPLRAALVIPGDTLSAESRGGLAERVAVLLSEATQQATLDVFDRRAPVFTPDSPRLARCTLRSLRTDPWSPDALRALGRSALDLVVDASAGGDDRARRALAGLGGAYFRVNE